MKEIKLKEIKAIPKSGSEKLTFDKIETKYSLLNFWQWSVSDVLSNATRGRFAEFIVGTAIELNINNLRDEWDAYDLTTKNGIKIEIKSSSFIQSWRQFDFSTISFSIKPTRHWDGENGKSRGAARRHADLYVFCLLNHKEQETIDPLKLEQWIFFVVPTYKLDNYKRSLSSITLNSLQKISVGISYNDLKEEIDNTYKEQLEYYKNHS